MSDLSSPRPWSIRTKSTPNGDSLSIVCRNGGVVAVLKNAGGRKLSNAAVIVAAVNATKPSNPTDAAQAAKHVRVGGDDPGNALHATQHGGDLVQGLGEAVRGAGDA